MMETAAAGVTERVNAVRDLSARRTVLLWSSSPEECARYWVVLSKGQTVLVGYQYGKAQVNVDSTKCTHG